MHTPDRGRRQREVSRRGVLLAAPVGLVALAGDTVAASFLSAVHRAGMDVVADAGRLSSAAFGSPRVKSSLTAALRPLVGSSTTIAVSVFDRRTGTRWAHRGDTPVRTGSVAKVLIVAAALRRARQTGRPLSSAQLEQARLAITQSDNASADALYAYIGGHAAVARLERDLGMAISAGATGADHWGHTLASANDLVRMMQALVQGAPALAAADRARVLSLMGQVVDGQRWGVGTVRTSSVKVRVKNGWMAVDEPWVINSVGDVRGAGRDYALAILQRAQPDEEAGMTRASRIGRAVFTALAP